MKYKDFYGVNKKYSNVSILLDYTMAKIVIENYYNGVIDPSGCYLPFMEICNCVNIEPITNWEEIEPKERTE